MDERISLMAPDAMGSDAMGSDVEPLMPWEDLCQKITLSPRARPSHINNPLNSSQLTSLLSASSYPMHGLFPAQDQFLQESYAPVPLYGGLVLDAPPDDNGGDLQLPMSGAMSSSEAPLSDQSQAPMPLTATGSSTTVASRRTRHNDDKLEQQERPSVEAKESLRKRGRPRKVLDASRGEDPEERRRMQVRMAQRAYRSRKEASISSLKGRIALLETAVKQMSTAVVAFNDEILKSGALETHPSLMKPLRDTVQTCLSLPIKDAETMSPLNTSQNNVVSIQQLPSPPTDQVATPPFMGGLHHNFPFYTSPSTPKPQEIAVMEVPAFIERLHAACLYQAYLVLANPAIPLQRIQPKFRMLLSIMSRERVVLYFKAALIAKASQSKLKEWNEIPFFSVGGAGTHYPRSRISSLEPEGPPSSSEPDWSFVEDALTQFPSDIRDDMEGDWFDIKDLEGYLQEKQIRFPMAPAGVPRPGPLVHTATNISRLIQALITGAICLGRTPGFRRQDVDKALEDFRNDYNNSIRIQ